MKLKTIISSIIVMAFFGWLIYYFISHINDFNKIKEVSIVYIYLILISQLAFLYINGLFNKHLFKIFKINLDFKEYFGLSTIASLWNYITPFRGGAGIRAIYLKQKYKLNYTKFISSLAGTYIIIFWITSLIAIIGLFTLYMQTSFFNYPLTYTFLTIFLGLTLIIVFSPKLKKRKNKLVNALISAINGWHTIRKDYKTISLLSLLTLLNQIVGGITIYLIFHSININISPVQAIIFSSVSVLSLLINITPGGLGIKEALIILTATIFNIGTAEALVASLIERGLMMILLFILGSFFSLILLTKLNKQIYNEQKGN